MINELHTREVARKAFFVCELNDLLISAGGGRYDYLKDDPLTYIADGAEEYVSCGHKRACVTGDSLAAMLRDISNGLF